MSRPVPLAPLPFARFAALVIFGLVTLLSVAGLVLTVLANESLWPNSAALVMIYAFPVVGVLIALHQPGNIVAWLCLAIGVIWALEGTFWGAALLGFDRGWSVPNPRFLAGLGDAFVMPGLFVMATLLLLRFPDGRLPSPRWRWVWWLSIISIAGMVPVGMVDPEISGWGRPEYVSPLVREDLGVLEAPVQMVLLSGLFCVIASIVALVRRYRRSSGIERLQLKWLMASGAGAALIWLVTIEFVEPNTGEEAAVAATVGAFALIPLAIGIAVLRYRLYEIDRLITRTLVYGLLTAGLGAIYVGLVVGLQTLLRPLSGGSDIAIVVTTLVVAALFLPARRRVQTAVDRRFNRHSYDATRTLEAFSARLREGIDLDTLRYELLAVVDETMQPARVSLWVRETEVT